MEGILIKAKRDVYQTVDSELLYVRDLFVLDVLTKLRRWIMRKIRTFMAKA